MSTTARARSRSFAGWLQRWLECLYFFSPPTDRPSLPPAVPQVQGHDLLVFRDRLRRARDGPVHRGLPHRGAQPLRPHQALHRAHPHRPSALQARLAGGAPAVLQPRGRAPVRPHRRGPQGHPEQPHALRPAGRRRSPRATLRLRRRLPHPRRHRQARLHPRHGPRRRARGGASEGAK